MKDWIFAQDEKSKYLPWSSKKKSSNDKLDWRCFLKFILLVLFSCLFPRMKTIFVILVVSSWIFLKLIVLHLNVSSDTINCFFFCHRDFCLFAKRTSHCFPFLKKTNYWVVFEELSQEKKTFHIFISFWKIFRNSY